MPPAKHRPHGSRPLMPPAKRPPHGSRHLMPPAKRRPRGSQLAVLAHAAVAGLWSSQLRRMYTYVPAAGFGTAALGVL